MLQPVKVKHGDGVIEYKYKAEVYIMDFLEDDGRQNIKTD